MKKGKLESPYVVSYNSLIVVLLFVALGATAGTNEFTDLMQKGLFEEEGNHNLPAAIEAYQHIVTRFDEARAVTATAIFRLGECYRKQGKTNEAAAQYQRIAREFADQGSQATLSEQNLGALGVPAARENNAVYDSASLRKRVAEIRKMPNEQRRVAAQQLLPNPTL